MALLATFAALVLVAPAFLEAWRTARFFDTDDAMRLVQVRDLLGGQAWFDLVAHRLHPPDAMLSHWSRVIDAPLAGMILVFSRFTGQDNAETLTRLVFPLLTQCAYFAALFALFRRMAGPRALQAGFFLAVLSQPTNLQFLPGRIDHHAPQILMLVLMALLSVRCLDQKSSEASAGGSAWLPVMLGCLIALSLAISIENLPFIAAILAVFGLGWIFAHEPAQRALRPLGLTLIAAPIAAFVCTVPRARYAAPVADAFGVGHLVVLAMTGALFLVCAAMPRAGGRAARLAVMTGAGAIIVAVVSTVFPYLLRDPLMGVDPLVRALWLANVHEARPLWLLVARAPIEHLHYVGPLLCGMAAIGWAIRIESGVARWRWIALAALALAGAMASVWQVRAMASAVPIVLVGGVWAVMRTIEILETRHAAANAAALTAVKASAVGALFCVQAWQALAQTLPQRAAAPSLETLAASDRCFQSGAFAPLRSLPSGRVLAPIDLGSFILAYTPHTVVAAAYHRNNDGNRLLIETMLAPPDKARALAERSHAAVLAFCPFGAEITQYVKAAPGGLAAALARGEPPPWLTRMGDRAAPIAIYAIR